MASPAFPPVERPTSTDPNAGLGPAPAGQSTEKPTSTDPNAGTAEETPWWRRAAAAATRGVFSVGGRVAGAAIGGVLGLPEGGVGAIPGAFLGGEAGGAGGSALGEYLAQKIEGRPATNWKEVAGEGALGLIPGGKAMTAGKALLLGGAQAGADTLMRHASEEGITGQNVGDVAADVGKTALWGSLGGVALHGLTTALKGGRAPIPTSEPAPALPRAAVEPPGIRYTAPAYDWSSELPESELGPTTPAQQVAGLDPGKVARASMPAAGPEVVSSRLSGLYKGFGRTPMEFENPDRWEGIPDAPAPLSTMEQAVKDHANRTPRPQPAARPPLSTPIPEPEPPTTALGPMSEWGPPGGLSADAWPESAPVQKPPSSGFRRLPEPLEPIGSRPYDDVLGQLFPNGLPEPKGAAAWDTALPEEAPTTLVGAEAAPSSLDHHSVPVTANALDQFPPDLQQKVKDLHAMLSPVWADDAAKSAATGGPVIDPTLTPEQLASKILNAPSERKLMSSERPIYRALQAFKSAARDETGAAATSALVPVAATGVGALGGAALDPQHPIKGGVEGALTVGGLALALQHPQAAMAARYFGLFGSPITVLKKAGGDVGNALFAAYEHAASGDVGTAKSILSAFFSPATVTGALEHFRANAPEAGSAAEQSFGPTASKIIGAPSRALKAVTNAAVDAYGRAGVSPEEAAARAYVGPGESKSAQAVIRAHGELGAYGKLMMPVARVLTNVAEQNFKTMPGVGALPTLAKALRGQPLEPGEVGKMTARQLAGLAAALYGYHAGSTEGPTHGPATATEKLGHALTAPVAMTLAASRAAGEAMSRKQNPRTSTLNRVGTAARNAIARDLPFPTGEDLDPRQWAAEYIPNGLSLLSSHAPSEYETPDALDPLLAKLPILNDLLLRTKKSALRGAR